MDDKKDKAPSFSKLLRGGGGGFSKETAKTAKVEPVNPQSPEEKSRRRPIFMPFARKEGEQTLFNLSYREWAFLFGAMLLLFGGMAAIRMLGPKDPEIPNWAEVAEVSPSEDGSRPPAGGEGQEDVVTQLKSRDTTRLVAPPSEYGTPKREESRPMGDVFREGLKAVERDSPPRPRLPGMLGALSAALGGIGGGSSVREKAPMSPEEVAAKLANISSRGQRGSQGTRLGYSGSQNVPGFSIGKRSREQGDGDGFGRARQNTSDDLNKKLAGAEKAAAEAGKPFGESAKGSSEANGASTTGGGDTPKQDMGAGRDNVNYQIARAPYPPDYADQKRRKHWFEYGWKDGGYEGVKGAVTEIGKGAGSLLGEPLKAFGSGFGGIVKGLFEETPPEPKVSQWVKDNCQNVIIPKGYTVSRVFPGEKVGDDTTGENGGGPIFNIYVQITGKKTLKEGDKEREQLDEPTQPCFTGGKQQTGTTADILQINRVGKKYGKPDPVLALNKGTDPKTIDEPKPLPRPSDEDAERIKKVEDLIGEGKLDEARKAASEIENKDHRNLKVLDIENKAAAEDNDPK